MANGARSDGMIIAVVMSIPIVERGNFSTGKAMMALFGIKKEVQSKGQEMTHAHLTWCLATRSLLQQWNTLARRCVASALQPA